jgi:DNA-binding NtrC family response regulator
VRIIASTKLNLLDKIADGTFRQDLYYRLDVLRIRVPALRERRDDIPVLTEHLLRRIARGQDYRIDDDAIVLLTQHHWPGNVRELYNTLERALLVSGGHITREVLQSEVGGLNSFHPAANPTVAEAATSNAATDAGGFKAAMEFAEKQLLVSALEACGGNKTAAANSLGMKASTFRDKLVKYGLK